MPKLIENKIWNWLSVAEFFDNKLLTLSVLQSTPSALQLSCDSTAALSANSKTITNQKNSECQLFSDNLKLQIRILTNPIKILYPTQLFSSKYCKNVHRGPETNQLSNSNHTISQKIVTKPIWRCQCQIIWRIGKFFKNIVCIKR